MVFIRKFVCHVALSSKTVKQMLWFQVKPSIIKTIFIVQGIEHVTFETKSESLTINPP